MTTRTLRILIYYILCDGDRAFCVSVCMLVCSHARALRKTFNLSRCVRFCVLLLSPDGRRRVAHEFHWFSRLAPKCGPAFRRCAAIEFVPRAYHSRTTHVYVSAYIARWLYVNETKSWRMLVSVCVFVNSVSMRCTDVRETTILN